ncbi:MAG: hypothetical protein ABIH37_04865 [archaeon]
MSKRVSRTGVEKARVDVGNLFVRLTARVYGGEIQKNGKNDPKVGAIDIINWDRNQAYESKGSISSDYHKIEPGQVVHNRNLQRQKFPLDYPEIYYFFWQYTKRGISKLQGYDMFRTVTRAVNRLLVVSFDIVEAGTNVWDTTGENSWGLKYMFRSSERAALTKEPESELERMKLNPTNYKVTRETVDAKQYKYKWTPLPKFDITYIINRSWRGLERL